MPLSKEEIEKIREEEHVRAEARKEFSKAVIPAEGFKSIAHLKSSLTTEQLAMLQSEFDKNKRSTGVAYLLLLLVMGIFGAHKFYLKRNGEGIIYLVMLALFFLVIPPFILAIFLILDLFTLPRQVREANEKIEAEKIQELFPDLYGKILTATTKQKYEKKK